MIFIISLLEVRCDGLRLFKLLNYDIYNYDMMHGHIITICKIKAPANDTSDISYWALWNAI